MSAPTNGLCQILTWMRRASALLALGALLSPTLASAQTADLPTATVLTTQVTGLEAGDGAAFDRTLRARLDGLRVVRTEGAVALDLEQIQLALGCMGETTECLSAVSTEIGTPVILAPSLARTSGTVVATILLFDARDGALRRGTREVSASDTSALLGSVDGLLREVFQLPPAETIGGDEPPPTTPAASPGLAPFPLVLIGVGAAALIAGAIAGGLSLADASTFQSAMFASPAEVDAALDGVLSRQRAEAMAADGLLIAGALLAVGGIAWELAAGREDGSSPLALAPVVSGTEIGLALSGTFGGDL